MAKAKSAPTKELKPRLVVAKDESPEDQEAIKLLRSRFNGSLKVTHVVPAEGEILPQLWNVDACYFRLSGVRQFMNMLDVAVPAPG